MSVEERQGPESLVAQERARPLRSQRVESPGGSIVKKLLLLVVLVALGAVIANKVRNA